MEKIPLKFKHTTQQEFAPPEHVPVIFLTLTNKRMKKLNHKEVVIGGKRLLLPFSLKVKGGRDVLECCRLLRLVPGKRAVFLGILNGKQVIIKLFFQTFRAEKHVKREVDGNNLLKLNGVAAPDILYDGTARDGRVKIVVFSHIFPSKHLGTLLNFTDDPETAKNFFKKLLQLLGDMHNAGLFHTDLHFNNFLVSSSQENQGAVYALDGDAIKKRATASPLGMKQSMKNLATVFAQLNSFSRPLVKDLVFIYFARRGITMKEAPLERFQHLVKKEEKLRLKNYLKKIYRNSTATICVHSWKCRWACKREFFTPEMEGFLNDPDRFFQLSREGLLKDGNTATVAKIAIGGKEFVVKRYNIKNYFHGLRLAFKRSRADFSWYNAHLFLKIGIKTPAPVAFKENRIGPFRGRAYLICHYVQGKSARQLFKEHDLNGASSLADKIVDAMEVMKTLMISHGDMKATNIIINNREPFFIDLDSMVLHKSRRFFARARSKDIKRFMKNFKHSPGVLSLFKSLKEEQL